MSPRPPDEPQQSRLAPTVQSVMLLGLAAIAVHVVDDTLVQPQPGTSAGDHLVSALVPLGLLALAGAGVWRGGRGRRSAIALAAGFFGIVAGTEAVYYTMHGGPSGDDFTGLLSLAAGLALVGAALATLWRERRKDGGRVRRYVRRSLILVLGALALFYVGLPVTVAYVATHVGRLPASDVDLGTSARDVVLTRSDGIELAGSYIPSRNGAAVIAFPGREGPQAHARMLASDGYGVLLFDQTGDGESQGDPNGLGWDGEKDVMAAIAFLKRQPDVERGRIGGLGLSVGGELLLETAAHSRDLQAVVSEGAGSRSFGEELERGGGGRWLAAYPISAMITAGMSVFSNETPPPHLKDLVSEIAPRSMFLIYTTHGVDTEDLNPLYFAAAHQPKAIWVIPEASHTGGIEARPREYERRVVGFFDRALLRLS
jgi:dienelactone hydrolase